MNKQIAVELVLKKRFGTEKPAKIGNILEINTFESLDKEENPLGIGVELILEKNGNTEKEEYQVNNDGIIYSWGNAPVIDERSLKQAPIIN